MKSLLIIVFISMAIAINPEYSQRYKPSLVEHSGKSKAEFKVLSPEERRKVSLFPKNMKKFVVTENPFYKNAFFTHGATVMTRRPIAMPKLDILDKTTPMSTPYKQPLIRPRLMKSRKFTIDDETLRPAIMEIVNSEAHKNIDNNVFEDEVVKTVEHGYENYANKDYSQQKDSKEILEYSEHYVEDAKNQEKIDDKIIVDIINENLNKKSTDYENYDYENSDDIISMLKKADKLLTNVTDVKVLDNQHTTEVRTKTDVINYQAQTETNRLQRDDNVSNFLRTQPVRKVEGEDFHELKLDSLTLQNSKVGLQNGESLESELEKIIGDRILRSKRSKRSINIIEEENTGTTVTGFKFTGREPTLLSDLTYRNINS